MTNPTGWPGSFGVLVSVNGVHPANFDLAVVYDPQGGGAGVQKMVTLEKFNDLSFNPIDPELRGHPDQWHLAVDPSTIHYSPPSTPPAGFPLTPTLLSNTGPVNLQDLGSPAETYLTLQPVNPAGWPALFGVIAQASANPVYFDLEVVLRSVVGWGGRRAASDVEKFTNLSLATAASQLNGNSILITVAELRLNRRLHPLCVRPNELSTPAWHCRSSR